MNYEEKWKCLRKRVEERTKDVTYDDFDEYQRMAVASVLDMMEELENGDRANEGVKV